MDLLGFIVQTSVLGNTLGGLRINAQIVKPLEAKFVICDIGLYKKKKILSVTKHVTY